MNRLLPILIILLSTFHSCKTIEIYKQDKKPPLEKKNNLVIFFDGTSNTPKDSTNITLLHNLLIKTNGTSSFYSVGVGSDPFLKNSGVLFGTGIGLNVREAYKFICENYNKEIINDIHILGFSRGAYTSKILANIVYLAGIIDLDVMIDDKNVEDLIKQIYRAYRRGKGFSERKTEIKKIIEKWNKKLDIKISQIHNVEIETLGLFDTVEALTMPDYKEKFCYPNQNHLEQFINVKNVFHAASLDDNRAQLFTPTLATCDEIQVGQDINKIVDEVWFSGAHSDVGGGYDKLNKLSNVSLHWMLSKYKKFKLFNTFKINSNDVFGKVEDAHAGYGKTIRRKNRDIVKYLEYNGEIYNNRKLKIHESVIMRLKEGIYPKFKISKKDSTDWFDKEPFLKCFRTQGNLRLFLKDKCSAIDVVQME